MIDNTDLIARLRVTTFSNNRQKFIETADALQSAQAEIDLQTKAADHWMAEANKSHNLTVTQQAEIERLKEEEHESQLHLERALRAKDSALARIAAIEGQEPVGYVAKGFLALGEGRISEYKSDTYVVPVYGAAGASPQPSQAGDAQDAARYRWLRSTTNWASNSNNERIDVRNSPELWDSAIDAAINAKEKLNG